MVWNGRINSCRQSGSQRRFMLFLKRTSGEKKLVLPDRIELSTSPLPMECSTTELRQHARETRIGQKRALQGGRSLPQGPRSRKRATGLRRNEKPPKSARTAGRLLQPDQ